ncbi:MAG: hypothetical protein IKH10_01605 [Bacteroidetes bacterium]|nr:hypothetical protein [Bacteroidota bacterium]
MAVTTFNVRDTFDTDGNLVMLSGNSALNQCLKVLLQSARKELFGTPQFGSKLKELAFTNMSDILMDILQDHLKEIVGEYDRRVEIEDIQIYFDQSNAVCYIDLYYSYETSISNVTIYVLTEEN